MVYHGYLRADQSSLIVTDVQGSHLDDKALFFTAGYCTKLWFNAEWYIAGVWYLHPGLWAVTLRHKGHGPLWGWGHVLHDNLPAVVHLDVALVANGESNERKD